MTPKKKAIDLVNKYTCYRHIFNGVNGHRSEIDLPAMKKWALIAVDEILLFIEFTREGWEWERYWKEVKKEILEYEPNKEETIL